jgi:hypothetical protein
MVPRATTQEAIHIHTYLHSPDTEAPMARQAGSRDRAAWLIGNPTSFVVALAKGRYR